MTEYFGVILRGIPFERVNAFVYGTLGIRAANLTYSQCRSEARSDHDYFDGFDFTPERTTAVLTAKTVTLDRVRQNAVPVIGHDEKGIEIDCSFDDTDFNDADIPAFSGWLRSLHTGGMITGAEI